ncbi:MULTISPECIES: putative oxygenase MesX, partial [unclassified Pseudomonas]
RGILPNQKVFFRVSLAIEQGQFVEEHFIKPYQTILEQWSASYAL